jgi:cbb3-type cytochrome oxidase maturation protein
MVDIGYAAYFSPRVALHATKFPALSVMIILLLASIAVATGFLVAFIWSVKNGQYDDEESPPLRMLFDDTPPKPESQS